MTRTVTDRSIWIVAALACLFTILALLSSWDDSPTWDEPEHATAGFCYVRTGEFWINPMHPPLWKAIAGLGVATQRPYVPWEVWDQRQLSQAAGAFLFSGQNDPQQLIRAARFPLILLSGAFLVAYYFMLRRELGVGAALISTSLMSVCPTFIAHSARVGNDAGATIMMFTTLWVFHRYRESGGRWALVLGVTLGLALLTKYSALLLLAILPAMGIARRRAKEVVVTAMLAVAVVWLGYTVVKVPADYQERYNEGFAPYKLGPILSLAVATHKIPVVRNLSWYLTGLARTATRFAKPTTYKATFAGSVHTGGRWTYFPRLLLAKIPSGSLLLLAAGALVSWRHRPWPYELGSYLAFGALLFLFACLGQINLGVRHILPLFPILFAWAGYGLSKLTSRRAFFICVGLYLWSVVSVIAAFPGYLAYYNSFVGGKQGGVEVALDSNYDWGQDLYRLALWAKDRAQDPIYVQYFGTSSPEFYLGKQYHPVPGPRPPRGWLAISRQSLQWARNYDGTQGTVDGLPPAAISWILSLKDPLVIGDSILVFRL